MCWPRHIFSKKKETVEEYIKYEVLYKPLQQNR